jgi:hypothetical protein
MEDALRVLVLGVWAACAGCGARTELGAPPSPLGDDGAGSGSGGDDAGCPFASVTVLATSSGTDVDVRLGGGFVYWNDGAILHRVSKAGGEVTDVVSGVIDVGDYDVGSNDTYFVTHGSAQIAKASGGTVATLEGPVQRIVADGDTLYIVAPFGDVEALYRVPLSSPSPVIITSLGIASLPSGDEYPQRVYGMVVRNHVAYVSMIGFPPNASIVASIDLGSGSVTQLSSTTLSLPVTSVAADDRFVYFADYIDHAQPAIWRVPVAGGHAEAIVSTPNYCTSCTFPTPLAVDSDSLYFPIDEFGATLSAWPTAGGMASTFANDVAGSISGIAADDVCVYWVAEGDGNVYAAPK